MQRDCWNLSDEQVVEGTGKPLAHWRKVLDRFGSVGKKSNETVAHLQGDHGVPRYGARTLTSWYVKRAGA